MFTRIALAACAAGLVAVPLAACASASAKPAAPAHVHPCTSRSSLVLVYLQDSESDGDPLDVACGGISHVHKCTGHGYGRTCLAKLDGVRSWVFVAGVDFPRVAYRSTK